MTTRPVCVQTDPTTEETEMTDLTAPDHGRVTDDPRDALASALLDHLLDHEGYAPSPKLAPLVVRLANVVLRAGWAPRTEPRVWLPGDTVPAGVFTLTSTGHVGAPLSRSWRAERPRVEVFVPDFDAAVADERARREAGEPSEAAVPSPEAGSPVSAREPGQAATDGNEGRESATAGDLPDAESAQEAP